MGGQASLGISGHSPRAPPKFLGPPGLPVCPQMEQEVSQFIQATGEPRRRFQPMNKIERSIL